MASSEKKRGQPTRYDSAAHIPWATSLAKRGCTVAEISEAFGVSERTVYRWSASHPEFCQALKESRSKADEAVVESLYSRACGNVKRVTKRKREVLNANGEAVTLTEVVEETLPPDTTAMIYWLKNRQPELWRDRPIEKGDEGAAEEFLAEWRDEG